MTTNELQPGPETAAKVAKAMGIDLTAHDPDSFGAAVMSGMRVSHGNCTYNMVWSDTDYFVATEADSYGYGGAEGNNGHGLWLWEHRHSMLWRNSIEKHVAAWRKEASPFTTDGTAALRGLKWLRENRNDVRLECDKTGWHCFVDKRKHFSTCGPTGNYATTWLISTESDHPKHAFNLAIAGAVIQAGEKGAPA